MYIATNDSFIKKTTKYYDIRKNNKIYLYFFRKYIFLEIQLLYYNHKIHFLPTTYMR
jgi:hypothetical protein